MDDSPNPMRLPVDQQTAIDFHKIGLYLYGEHYRAPLAYALGVDKNWIKNWAKARSHIPPTLWPELAALIVKAQAERAALLIDIAMIPELQA